MSKKFYGKLVEYENISFVLDGFQCILFRTDLDFKRTPICVCQTEGFILGKTSSQQYIYIFSGNDLNIFGECRLNTWLYFVSSHKNIQSYKAICFRGGVLNKLFLQSSLNILHDESIGTKIRFQDDSKRFNLSNEKIKGELAVHSTVEEKYSVEEGNSIKTTGVELLLSFEQDKTNDTIMHMVRYIFEMCKFMTFRHNIRFDEILLMKKYQDSNYRFEEIATCYVKYDHTKDTEKNLYRCISFDNLDFSVDKLLDSIIKNENGKPSFSIGFIPESDEDVEKIDTIKIREVLSSLESEMEAANISVQYEENFTKLIKDLKKVVKDHRKSEEALKDEKIYDYIFGTINHMQGALADRIEKCYMENQSLITQYISRPQIDRLVKYRNIITHGNYALLDQELADTTYATMELVYCCILKRIGVREEVIKTIFERHVLS